MEGISRIRKWLAENRYDGVILNRRDNYSWITGGNKNHVLSSTETGVASLVITREGIALYADSSDGLRMEQEQNNLDAELLQVPWYENMETILAHETSGRMFVSDTGIARTKNVRSELIELRMQLTGREVSIYQKIGQECAGIVEQVCMEAQPGQTEMEIANRLKARCLVKGISPECVLVGSDERILKYRHPMPTNRPIEESLMVVLGGEKQGLNVSMTRMVYFTNIPEEIIKRYKAVQKIFAAMQQMMKTPVAYQEYFKKVQGLYRQAGYAEEWKLHHQGGPTGYGCREQVISPDTPGAIKYHQAYAWNPTITGTKCEETSYLDETGVSILTQTGQWPREEIETEYGICSVAEIMRCF